MGWFIIESKFLSGDGQVVAGEAFIEEDDRAQTFFWRIGQAPIYIGFPTNDYSNTESFCLGVSGDGSTIIGEGYESAWYWTEQAGIVDLGCLDPSPSHENFHVQATAVSYDGSVITGRSSYITGNWDKKQAYRYTKTGGMTALGLMGTGERSEARCMNADGSVIYGFAYTTPALDYNYSAWFRWTSGSGCVDIGRPVGADISYGGPKISSPDGTKLVAQCLIGGVVRAAYWDATNGWVVIPMPSGLEVYSVNAISITDSGLVIGYNAYSVWYWTLAGGLTVIIQGSGSTQYKAVGSSLDGDIVWIERAVYDTSIQYTLGICFGVNEAPIWMFGWDSNEKSYNPPSNVWYNTASDDGLRYAVTHKLAPATNDEWSVVFSLTQPAATIEYEVERLMRRAGLEIGEYDVTGLITSPKTFRGMAVSQVVPVRTTLEMLASSYFFEVLISDKIYFNLRGGSTVATIPYSDLISSGSEGDPLPLKQQTDIELPVQIAVAYTNATYDFNIDIQLSDRLVSTANDTVDEVEVPLVLIPEEAKGMAETMQLDRKSALVGTDISVLGTYASLSPADAIVVQDRDGSSYRFRIVQKTDDYPKYAFRVVMDDATVISEGDTDVNYASSTIVNDLPDTEMAV